MKRVTTWLPIVMIISNGIADCHLVSLESRRRAVEGIRILPWQEFLAELWDGAYV